jgi:hypothetical protein
MDPDLFGWIQIRERSLDIRKCIRILRLEPESKIGNRIGTTETGYGCGNRIGMSEAGSGHQKPDPTSETGLECQKPDPDLQKWHWLTFK